MKLLAKGVTREDGRLRWAFAVGQPGADDLIVVTTNRGAVCWSEHDGDGADPALVEAASRSIARYLVASQILGVLRGEDL